MIVATVSHMLQTPAVATAIAHELGTDTGRRVRHLRRLRRLLPRHRARPPTWSAAGSAKHVLVIGVERLSDITDPTDRGTAFIFADGAGAAVVGPSEEPGIGPVVWGSDGEQFDLIRQNEDWTRRARQDDADDAAPAHAGQPGVPLGVVRDGQGRAGQALDRPASRVDDLDVFVPAPGQHADHRRDGPRP